MLFWGVGKKLLLILLIFISIIAGLFYLKQKSDHQKFIERGKVLSSNVVYPPDYLVVLVGDSMTEYLGNFDELRVYMSEYYPNNSFDFLNYGFGSTNILSLEERLTKWTKYGRDFKPILDIPFNLIIIESFGYNPLSELPLQEGLKKQTETLDKVIDLIRTSKPSTKIVLMATIAPNSNKYGQGSVDLSAQKRQEWVQERVAYIKNHIEYGKSRNIPVINVFDASKDLSGNGKLEYIEDKTYIHPSPSGVMFISKQIADYIHQNNLLTK